MNRYDIALGKKSAKTWDEMTGQERADLFNTILDNVILDNVIRNKPMKLSSVTFDQLYGYDPWIAIK
jgi:hypothetical protein